MCSGFRPLTDDDLYLFNQGSHSRAYNKLGAHEWVREGVQGTFFAVWAPDAERVFVTGSFNDWDKETDELHPRGNSGIWESFIAGADKGSLYKYVIQARFMGQRLEMAGPFSVFNEIPPRTASIVWDLLKMPLHAGVQKWVADLNRCYRDHGALHELDVDPAEFEWIDCHDADASVVSLLRMGRRDDAVVLIVCNFTPVVRRNYRIGAPRGGLWNEILNSDAKEYGGSGVDNLGSVEAGPVSSRGRRHSLCLTLPPLSVLFLAAAEAAQWSTGSAL